MKNRTMPSDLVPRGVSGGTKQMPNIFLPYIFLSSNVLRMLMLLAVSSPTGPLSGFTLHAQDNGAWHDKKCAVALTYDDALNVHLDHAVPILDSLGLKATFYLSGYFPAFRERVADWKAAAAKGHELGNHTLFHPCTGNLPGREWVQRSAFGARGSSSSIRPSL